MIPPFQELMLPIMKLAKSKDGTSTPNREFIDRMAEEFRLSEEDRKELLASGTQSGQENKDQSLLSTVRNVFLKTDRLCRRIARLRDLRLTQPPLQRRFVFIRVHSWLKDDDTDQ